MPLAITSFLPLLVSKYMSGVQSDGHQRGNMNPVQAHDESTTSAPTVRLIPYRSWIRRTLFPEHAIDPKVYWRTAKERE